MNKKSLPLLRELREARPEGLTLIEFLVVIVILPVLVSCEQIGFFGQNTPAAAMSRRRS